MFDRPERPFQLLAPDSFRNNAIRVSECRLVSAVIVRHVLSNDLVSRRLPL